MQQYISDRKAHLAAHGLINHNPRDILVVVRPFSKRPWKGGESADTVARKKGYLKNAQEKWRFLTSYDLSSIETESQLCSMVKTRSSISAEQTKKDAEA